jgi:Mg2+ and Co2+ transporter CorA
MTEKMKNLTQDTVDDSATVRIITYVSAFYLPGSFVASMYGMNFFVFDTTSQNIAIANDFWIFVATWLPLTAITVAVYIGTLWFVARRKGKQGRWLWTQQNLRPSTGNIM